MDFIEWSKKHQFVEPEYALLAHPIDPEVAFLKPKKIFPFVYNGVDGDLHDMSTVPNSTFDFALVSQTFEHLYDPHLAACNLFSKLKPGGLLFVSAPALNKQHMTPVHFFHYTPMGLAITFARAGFEIGEHIVSFWV